MEFAQFISVQIPFFNEKYVALRAIKASTNFDYGGDYEVIVCDDSTDETTDIVRNYMKSFVPKNKRLKIIKGDGWDMAEVQVRDGVTLKHLHRTSRYGFKGAALDRALTLVHPDTEYISVFDADFVPYPDTLTMFMKYFQASTGTLDFVSNPSVSNIAAVQGYQWHVLNKSENWITRGVRSEYAGSYVIERAGQEIYGGLKHISGSVYAIRRDVLEKVGWETSITEDYQLTLKLYEKGYKVLYTPYIQAPAECVSTLKRLIKQRMRWAEGHCFNVKLRWKKLLFGSWSYTKEGKRDVFHPSPLTPAEKMEFLFNIPYYLQAFLFLIGTFAWLLSEAVFRTRLPFWTSLWGWSLVLTNMISLPLVNAVGLFLEESEERDYLGLMSFVVLSYILVPFQAYASVKGFLEKEEGGWFRTPKTGIITDVLNRGRFYRFISGIFPQKASPSVAPASKFSTLRSQYLDLVSANNTFSNFGIKRRNSNVGKLGVSLVLAIAILIVTYAPLVPVYNPGGGIPQLITAKTNYSIDELPEFVLKLPNNTNSYALLASETHASGDGAFSTKVMRNGKEVDVDIKETVLSDNSIKITLNPLTYIQPGNYSLISSVELNGHTTTTSQDFSWGVLTINMDKNVYSPGESVVFDIAVLDDRGRMVCDSKMALVVTDPKGNEYTLSGEDITVNENCYDRTYQGTPDYEASFVPSEYGNYSVHVEANVLGDKRSVDSMFLVSGDVPFEITRDSATRIYPVDDYEMSIMVVANEDFVGDIHESIPSSFEIVRSNADGEEGKGETKDLVWHVNMRKGDTKKLSYVYDAPDISPYLYEVGELKFRGTLNYTEARPWYIAADALGDIGIWVDQNGSLTATTTFATFPFEGTGSEERNDGIYTYNASTDNVTLNEAGNYLVLSYIHYKDTSNGRANWQSRVTHNGSPVAGSWGYGYVRNTGNSDGFIRGAGMVLNASANDTVALEWRRDSDAGTGGSVAGKSSLTIVRLPDDSEAAYGYYGTPTANSFNGTTWTDATGWDVIRETNTASIELQTGGSDIRLKDANRNYLIIYGIPFYSGNSTRTQRIGRAVSGTTEIEQSSSYFYRRNANNEYGVLYSMFVYRTSSANEDISIQGQRGLADQDGSTTMMNGTGEAGVVVVELPDYVETFISVDDVGGQDVSQGGLLADLNLMRTVDYNDSTSFTKEGIGHETMRVEKNMDMLVTASCRIERTDTSGTRLTLGSRFEIEGVDQDRSEHGTYVRGNQSSADTYNGSINPAGVFAVSANDSVQVEVFDSGNDGSNDATVGGSCGFSAVNIDTFTPPNVTQQHYRWRNDDGTETTATWAASEDTTLTDVAKETLYRLRFGVSNEGGGTSGPITYQLQVAKTATCSSGTYTAVPTDTSGDWQIVDSLFLVDGVATTNVSGGLTDEATTFVAGEVKDTGNTTGSITLAGDEFTEIEFAIQATTNATDNGNYCFRLYDTTNGVALDTYTNYAEAVVVPEYLWLLFGLGPILPGLIRRRRKR